MKRNILAASILFGLAGFAGNWFKAELFFNVDFLFGSFFVMLAILRFGPLAGVVAGVMAASCTYILWHHPWSIIIFLAEAAFVAWRTGKKGRKILTQDILFWLVLGMPLVWLFYHQVMGIQPQPTLTIMLKQSINGIFNALLAGIANLLLQTFSRDRDSLPAFRETIFTIMVSILMFPAIISVIFYQRNSMDDELNRLAAYASQVARITHNSVNVWVEKNHQSVIGLSKLIGDPDTTPGPVMQRLVTEVKEVSPQFKRMGVLDRNATTIAYSPMVDHHGNSTIGVNFSDRAYLPILMAKKKPMIGDVVMGRFGPPNPMVPFLAPLISSGEYNGFCVGILDEEQIRNVLSSIVVKGDFDVTLLDSKKKIIVSTRSDLKPMDRLATPRDGRNYQITADVRHWVPTAMPGTSIMQRWEKSLLVSEIDVGHDGWFVRVEASLLPLLTGLNSRTINGFLFLFFLLLAVVGLSYLISGSLIYSVERLQEATGRLPQQLEIEDSERYWPVSRIAELDKLIYNFTQMSQALKGAFRDQRQLNEYLEQRVSERTALLKTVNEQLQEEIAERQRAEDQLLDALREKEVLLKEVHHRVKNNLQVVISLLNMQSRQDPDGRVRQALQDSRDRIRAMALIHETLHRSSNLAKISIKNYTQDLVRILFQALQGRGKIFTTSLDMEEISLPIDQAVPCGLILNELITNALKYGLPGGKEGVLRIEARMIDSDEVELQIRDNGPGLPEDIERLKETSLGLNLVSILVEGQLLGRLTMENDHGAVFKIRWPFLEKAREERANA
ncbi:MAG: hypothetical protein HQK56_00110 [Deltaproteobacteria bacterium]|nr:hypothetical protein [Deltaproteobacteria bacterium]